MKILQILSILLSLFFFLGCANKEQNLKNIDHKTIYIKKIKDDNLNLKQSIKDALEKKENIKLKTKNDFANSILVTKILNSSIEYNYFTKPTNTIKCLKYELKDNYANCLEYGTENIPCKKKKYILSTKVDLVNKNEELIFSKTYTKNTSESRCKKSKYSINPTFILPSKNSKKIKEQNTKLANKIAKEIAKDLNKKTM